MNRIIIILGLLTIALVSCEKDKPIKTDTQEKEIDVEANYFYNIDFYENEGRYPVAYKGDTLKYQISFKSNTNIKYISAYFLTESGTKYEMPLYYWDNDYLDNTTWIDKHMDSLTYYYPLTDHHASYSHFDAIMLYNYQAQKTSLIFEYNDSVEVVHADTLPEIFIKPLDEFSHQRLYNIAAGKDYVRGYSYTISQLNNYRFQNNINCGGPCKYANDTSLFMTSIPNSDFDYISDTAITKDFIEGWHSPKKNHYFVKVNKEIQYYDNSTPTKVEFDYVSTTSQLINIYNDNEAKLTEVVSPKVGDLYAFRYIHTFNHVQDYKYGDVYGLIEVVHIENDNLTSENGGDDFDYIEFRIKSFGETFRFQ